MHLALRKIETTLQERMAARTLQADFGGIPDDLPERAVPALHPVPSAQASYPPPTLHAVSA
jgi:hypothetical protein